MVKSIIVIGIGSLGGYVANSISNLEYIEKIAIMDDDIVEEKNILNSIYSKQHVNKLKIDCLKEIIQFKNKKITIKKYNCKYITDETILPYDYDLILDCRDFTYDRCGDIDCRLYISSRYLILDCKHTIKYEKANKGRYIEKLKKSDLRNAGNIIASLIDDQIINKLVNEKITSKFDLDYYKRDLCFDEDVIYDSDNSIKELNIKILNLPNNIQSIIEKNKNNDLKMCICGHDSSNEIPMNSIQNINDLSSQLNNFINIKNEITCYFAHYTIYLNNNIIELIPETGAA